MAVATRCEGATERGRPDMGDAETVISGIFGTGLWRLCVVCVAILASASGKIRRRTTNTALAI